LQYRGNNVIASSLASGFFIVSALLLLAAALTAGSLLQARTLRRQRAHATALALGASRANLVRDAIVEHAILAVSAAALAIGLTSFAVRALQAALPQDLPGWIQFGVDWRVLAFVSCVLALVIVVHALAAAREIGRVEPARALAEANAALTPGVRRSRRGAAIVRAQVLLMSPLVVSASIVATQHAAVAWGWDATGLQRSADLLVFQHDESKKDLSLRRRLSDEIAERMEGDRRIDLLTRYGAPTGVRGGPDFVGTRLFEADGVEGRLLETEIPFLFGVDSVYFAIRAQPILRGRHFVPSDSLGPTLAMIVESSAAAALWGSADAVGRRARIGSADGPVAEVVGVVADRREPTVSMSRRVVLTGRRQVYLSKWQVVDGQPRISVRASSSVEDARAAFVEAAAALDPGAEPLVESLGEKQRLAMLPLRLVTSILVAAAAFVHALAIIGVFALVRLRIADRRQELGVRLAVGASPPSLRAMLVRDVWSEIIPGLVVGVALSCAAVAVALEVTTMPTASVVLATLASLGALLASTFVVVATSSASVLNYSPIDMLRNRL
jgi:hypothetical protein